MSRLDSMLRRLTAQRDGLNWAAAQIETLSGEVLDMGLGNGRTYDHLREVLQEIQKIGGIQRTETFIALEESINRPLQLLAPGVLSELRERREDLPE